MLTGLGAFAFGALLALALTTIGIDSAASLLAAFGIAVPLTRIRRIEERYGFAVGLWGTVFEAWGARGLNVVMGVWAVVLLGFAGLRQHHVNQAIAYCDARSAAALHSAAPDAAPDTAVAHPRLLPWTRQEGPVRCAALRDRSPFP